MKTRLERYRMRAEELRRDRTSIEPVWRDQADYIAPHRARFSLEREKGQRKDHRIIDPTASLAARTLSAGIHSGHSSPAAPWLKLTTPDPELNLYEPVQVFLSELTKRMLAVFQRTNLYNCLPTLYYDEGVFAVGAMGMFASDRLFRCYSYPIGSYWLGTNAEWSVDTFYSEERMTVRTVVEAYGKDHVSGAVLRAYERGDRNGDVDVCHLVQPNEDHRPGSMGGRYKRYASCRWEKGASGKDSRFLSESGYDEFPVVAPRWETTGADAYGSTCPGRLAIGAVKALQFGERKAARAIDKHIDPPLEAPSDMRTNLISLLPGDVTYRAAGGEKKQIHPINEVNLRLDMLESKQAGLRAHINEAFYKDLMFMFAMSRDQDKTATEVLKMGEEKLQVLGAVLEQQNGECLTPVVDRTFGLMLQAGLVPEPPAELYGMPLRIEFISMMAQAQKLAGLSAQERFLSNVFGMAELFGEVRHKVRPFVVVDNFADILGVDPNQMVPDEEAAEAAAAEAQQMAEERQAEQLAVAAKGVRDVSQADPEVMQQLLAGVGR